MTAIENNSSPPATGLFSRFLDILRREFAPVEQNGVGMSTPDTESASKAPEFHGQWRVLKDL